ncbi:hypothetical protein TNIN_383901 [Trichonephila inaurata madagascariensis]|uniref:Uncharacterized protein n=1 Tax=Trichonephila inaurata madagascariensis TaxID=2747483 RepID=A0A8X6MH31_9ARAC|nr:hypothetical protein TNIN_383901 [Trichonephila inaurata madagascariensis]
MPNRYRHSFVYLLITGDNDASFIWKHIKDKLSEDCKEMTTLSIIRKLLGNEGFTLKGVGVPDNIDESQIITNVKTEEDLKLHQHMTIYESMMQHMNDDQLAIFKHVEKYMLGLLDKKLFFIDEKLFFR